MKIVSEIDFPGRPIFIQLPPGLRPDNGVGSGAHQGVQLASVAARRQGLDILLHGKGRQSRLNFWPNPKDMRDQNVYYFRTAIS